MGFWHVTKKDLLLLGRDRRALIVLLVFPLALISILGVSTSKLVGWRTQNQRLHVAVVNQSGDAGLPVISALRQCTGLLLIDADNLEESRALLADQDALVGVVIGADFAHRAGQLQLADVLSPANGVLISDLEAFDISIETADGHAGAGKVVDRIVSLCVLQSVLPAVARQSPQLAELMAATPAGKPQSATTTDLPESATNLASDSAQPKSKSNVYQELVPAYTVMFAFFLINIMARSFITERQLGTLQRLQLAPLTTTGLLVGKTLPFLLLSLAQCLSLFLIGKLVFGMSWGDAPWLLVPVIACTSLAAVSLGLLTAAVVRTDSQVSAYGNFLVITMAGVSGCFMPRDWLPESMQTVSLATPHAWSLIAFEQLLSGNQIQLAVIAKSCGMLLAFSTLFFALGIRCFRANH